MGTVTATTTRMGTDTPSAAPAPLLALLWLASPALPVGGFSYSEALEAAVEAGVVHDEASAGTWLLSQLHLAQARSELAIVAAALQAWAASGEGGDEGDIARIQALNDWVLCTRETAESRRQSEQMGRSMADWLRQRDPADARAATLAALAPAPTWPLAFALGAARSGASARDTLLAMAFGWAENGVQAAVKAVPLGQSAGQRLLAALAAAIPAAVDDALALDDDTRQAFTPMAAILGAQHETQYSRLFRS
jgi:urease accessory protein